VLQVLSGIPASELDESLLVLPFSYVLRLLPLLAAWLKVRMPLNDVALFDSLSGSKRLSLSPF
jgi:hypothetical protein